MQSLGFNSMSVCPNCAHEFPKIENILLRFRSKLCPKCGVKLKHDSEQFVVESVLFGVACNILFVLAPYEKGVLTIKEGLSFTHVQTLYIFLFVWLAFLFISVFFRGNIIEIKPQPSFSQQVKKMLTYEPACQNFEFKKAWVLPIVFFIGLLGIVISLVLISSKLVT
ncbi:MAG: hypothetical protein GQ583_04825 [Methyloprofundus sp.]|nr:hypothetical protein [Methyloprofundus sp.]